MTVNITSNHANGQFEFEIASGTGGVGSDGGDGGVGNGGIASNGFYAGGSGGGAVGGNGGNAGEGGVAMGGGLFNSATGTLSINPQLGAQKKSKQAKATDLISTNQAYSAPAGSAGDGGAPMRAPPAPAEL